jgi:EpsI family protein
MGATVRHLLLAVAFLATFGFAKAVTPSAPPSLARLADLPLTIGGWTGRAAPPLDPQVQATLGADQYVHRYYFADRSAAPGSRAVEMDVSYYARPRVGANMHSPLNCLPGTGWQIVRVDDVPLGGDARVRALTVTRGEHAFAMAYWFQSRDRVLSGEFSTRFRLLADALERRPTDAGLVRVMAPVAPGGNAHDVVLGFASRLVPALARILEG